MFDVLSHCHSHFPPIIRTVHTLDDRSARFESSLKFIVVSNFFCRLKTSIKSLKIIAPLFLNSVNLTKVLPFYSPISSFQIHPYYSLTFDCCLSHCMYYLHSPLPSLSLRILLISLDRGIRWCALVWGKWFLRGLAVAVRLGLNGRLRARVWLCSGWH